MCRRIALIGLVICSLAQSQDYDSYYEEIGVVLYQLQVNVRDKNGDPIRGLTKDDFKIRLDGDLQEIQTVEEIALESMVNENDWRALEDIPQQARRVFVFFFDLRYSTRRGLSAAREAATEFVQSEVLPSDLVGIFAYHPLGGINMVTNFTSDSSHLLKALDVLSFKEGRHIIQDPAGYFLGGLLDDFVTELSGDAKSTYDNPNSTINLFSTGHLQEMVELAAKSEQRNYDREVLHFLGNLKAFANGLKYVRGRKNLVWFSAGFDSSGLIGASFSELSENAERAIGGNYERVRPDQLGEGDIQAKVSEVISALQGSGTVIFSIDTSLTGGTATEKTGLQTLNTFSVDTGGRVFTSNNDLYPAMETIKDITNDYYLVSFYPEAKLKRGEVGRLKVKVDYPRAKVYTTKGLILEPNYKEMSELEKRIHLAEFISRDQIVRAIPFEMKTHQIPNGNQLVKLSVQAEIRGDYFLVSQSKKKPRDMEIFTYAFVQKDNQIFDSTHFQFKIETHKLKSVLTKSGVKYFANLFVKPGAYKIKMVVRDMETGKVGTAISDIVVQEPDKGLIAQELVSGSPWVLLRDSAVNERRKRLGNLDFSYPFQLAQKPAIPSIQARVTPGQKAQFIYLLNCDDPVSGNRPPQIASVLTGPSGQPIQLPPKAFLAEYDFKKQSPFLGTVLVTVDLKQLELQTGSTYKLLTQISLEGKTPIRATSPFLVDTL